MSRPERTPRPPDTREVGGPPATLPAQAPSTAWSLPARIAPTNAS
jgi:hypothetical protein